jgi:hypothetical protein
MGHETTGAKFVRSRSRGFGAKRGDFQAFPLNGIWPITTCLALPCRQ